MPVNALHLVSSPEFPSVTALNAAADARWAAWVERGRHHDRIVNRRMRVAMIGVAAIGLLVALGLALTPGIL